MYYYQVGGLGAHTFSWFRYDTRGLSEFIFAALSAQSGQNVDEKKSHIELVLGILTTGSSYLLVSEAQMDTILRFRGRNILRRPNSPRHASTYASLSPISFHSPDELYAKLKTYEQNTKKRKSGKALDKDTSQANKMFDQYNPARASFEHQRVLWSAIRNPIDINKFGLCELPIWIASTSFVALTLQIWCKENIMKQRKDPTILSLELANVRCIAFEQDNYAGKISQTIQVKIKEHAMMTNGPTMSRSDASLEVVKTTELGRRLNEFFASIDSKHALLLVHDAEQTLSALRKLGVDVSSYQEGIGTLLFGQNRKQEDTAAPSHSSSRGTAYDFPQGPRIRSRSPGRRSSYPERARSPLSHNNNGSKPHTLPARGDAAEENDEEEEGEDTAAPPPAKVYVIDVRALFLAVSRFAPGSAKDLHELTSRLGIPDDPNWNECRLLIEAWRSMASGKAIDEQHAERTSSGAFAARCPESRQTVNLTPATADEEIDPNDVVVDRDASRQPLKVADGGCRPLTDDFDSDDSDF